MLNEGQTGGETIVAAEKVVSSPQMLLSTAFVSTRVYEVTEKNQQLPSGVDPKKTCYDTETSIKTEGHSWSMAINVLTEQGQILLTVPIIISQIVMNQIHRQDIMKGYLLLQ